jgi:hypothetical protein
MTPEEKERLRSIGHLRGGRTRDKKVTITRPENDPGIDAGQRAQQTTDELGTVITESPNRQDVNIHPETHIQTLKIGL